MKRLYHTLFLICILYTGYAQDIEITGTVTDDSGQPLPGANIMIKGTKNITHTDFDGNFEIMTLPNATLRVSFVGYQTQEIPVQGRTQLSIVLEEDYSALEQIVLVGSRKPIKVCGGVVADVIEVINITKLGNASGQTSVSETFNTSRRSRKRRKRYKRRKQKKAEIRTKNRTDAMYATTEETGFQHVHSSPLSTFSIDVDKASYSDIRNHINSGMEIPTNMVKIEEMVNYFQYDYPIPTDNHPFTIHTELGKTPWNDHTQLVKIGLQGKKLPLDKIPASNLVFLIDVSGSMSDDNKLPLLVKSFQLLVNQLREKDKVAIVVYAGAAGVVLPPTSGADKATIIAALENLNAGGSTAGGQGIELAYALAQERFNELPRGRAVEVSK